MIEAIMLWNELNNKSRWDFPRLGVKSLRTGLSWADGLRPNALAWFDRRMRTLDEFSVTLTSCFTPSMSRSSRNSARA